MFIRKVFCLLSATVFLVAALSFVRNVGRSREEKPGMVLKHVVMYKFKDDQKSEQVQEVIDTFAALRRRSDKIIGFETRTNVSQEGKSEGFTHMFVVTFRDQAGFARVLGSSGSLAIT